MGATLLTLRDRVKRLLNNDDFFSDQMLDEHINSSYHFHHAIVTDALEMHLTLTDFIDSVANQREYDLDTDRTVHTTRLLDQVVRASFKSQVGGVSYFNLDYETMDDIDEGDTVGTPQRYEVIGNKIILDPIPNNSIVGGLRIRFDPIPLELSLDADQIDNVFNGLGEKCIQYYAAMSAKAQEELWDSTATELGGFKSIYEDMVLRFKNNLQNRAYEDDDIDLFDLSDV